MEEQRSMNQQPEKLEMLSGLIDPKDVLVRWPFGPFPPGSQRAFRKISFDQTDEDHTTRSVSLSFKPQTVMALSNIRSDFGGRLKWHGGLSVGFADLTGRQTRQVAIGPVTQVVQQASWQRSSAIGPGETTGAEAEGLGDLEGIALGLIEGDVEPDDGDGRGVLMVRVSRRFFGGRRTQVRFELRRSDTHGHLPLASFRIETHLIFFG